ncbi:MAG TPA: hypothetical protein VNF26_01765 [Candidatus Baltobacterales bacterium]|nr:hypothetical protein [Candidatus Baltobacterales bacterium]
MTGRELRAERLVVTVQGQEIAEDFGRHPAFITRLEQRDSVDRLTVERYRLAIVRILQSREAARIAALAELARDQVLAWGAVLEEVGA